MYTINRILPKHKSCLLSDSLNIGDLAEIVMGYDKDIILKTYDGFTSLSNPRHTWGIDTRLEVRKLPPGTVIELIVNE